MLAATMTDFLSIRSGRVQTLISSAWRLIYETDAMIGCTPVRTKMLSASFWATAGSEESRACERGDSLRLCSGHASVAIALQNDTTALFM